MSGSSARQNAVNAVTSYRPPASDGPLEAPGKLFGYNVFSKSVMQARLPKAVYRAVMGTIELGEPLDRVVRHTVFMFQHSTQPEDSSDLVKLDADLFFLES